MLLSVWFAILGTALLASYLSRTTRALYWVGVSAMLWAIAGMASADLDLVGIVDSTGAAVLTTYTGEGAYMPYVCLAFFVMEFVQAYNIVFSPTGPSDAGKVE